MKPNRRLPAEWEEQDGVLLAWPHALTDWQPLLHRVEPSFIELATRISHHEQVVIVAPDREGVRAKLCQAGAVMNQVRLVVAESNDTWARDFGPITILAGSTPTLLDFTFNGWGLKFPADRDNLITRRLHQQGIFGKTPLEIVGLVLEGGSIESDGKGTLLSTGECLLSPNRNPHLTKEEIEQTLADLLGSTRILWLENGFLAGDDTDSHIDTLARFCPADTIIHVTCDDTGDEHFDTLQKMTEELRTFRTTDNRPYRLVPLPWPTARFAPDGHRLPATYANFLVINDAVLVPTYGDTVDKIALERVGEAFPGRQIIGIDSLPLILQHGSLHCVTMQMPKGTLKSEPRKSDTGSLFRYPDEETKESAT